MATRNLTDVYVLMRNNALRNRHLFSDQVQGWSNMNWSQYEGDLKIVKFLFIVVRKIMFEMTHK